MTQSNPLRVGLIGAGGRWGPSAHVPALKGVPETELYAVCTAHADTAQAAADKLGVRRAYGNDKALNADAEVEAVLVAVRVPAHYELSKNAIEAGKHVYCEWPLGANTKEAEELAALARQKNVRTMAGLQRRASPAYLYMRELIQQGYVGQGGEELRRKIRGGHKDDKALQELPVPERFKWVPEAVRNNSPAYDVGQMWVKFAEAIRTGSKIESDFDHAVRRHRTLDAIVRASQTGQRQKVAL